MRTELYVGLKIPDTTAITTKRTLDRLGIRAGSVRRYQHYEIEAETDVFERARTCDVLVNANKHTAERAIAGKGVLVIVREESEDAHLKTTLERLGIPVRSVRANTAWMLDTDEATARRAADELLHNPHYQSIEVRE